MLVKDVFNNIENIIIAAIINTLSNRSGDNNNKDNICVLSS